MREITLAAPIVMDSIGFYQKALSVRTYQQELLASNIANADTPNFKARDVDFKSALQGALGHAALPGQLPLARTTGGHLAAAGANRFDAAVKYRTEHQPNADGNTVNMDVERASFAENALHIEALLAFIRAQGRDMSAALAS